MIIFHTPEGSLKLLQEAPLLDLANSTDRQRGREIDFLTVANLPQWALLAGLADESLVQRLVGDGEVEEAASDARALRGLVIGTLLGRAAEMAELAGLLNGWLPTPLVSADPKLNLVQLGNASAQLRANLALATVSLLLGHDREHIRQCPAERCTWFYLDRSGGRRQWCTMEGCGNLEKARRLRRRRAS